MLYVWPGCQQPPKMSFTIVSIQIKKGPRKKILRVIIINQLRATINRVVAIVTYYGLLLA